MAASLTASDPRWAGFRARLLALLAAALLATTLVAGSAYAFGGGLMHGSVSCNMAQPQSWLQYRAAGEGAVSPPGISGYSEFTHSGYETNITSGVLYGGGWWVESDVGINGEATFGFCTL